MARWKLLSRMVLENFGPLIVFYGVNHFYGLKPAVAISLVFSVLEILYMRRRGEPITGFFKFSFVLTFVFGFIDLYMAKSVFFKYEGALTSVIMGVYFGKTAFDEKPMIVEFAERQQGRVFPPEVVSYLRVWTVIWAGYFVVKGVFYAWAAHRYDDLEKTLLLRFVIGNGSMVALWLLSALLGGRIFRGLKRLGWVR